MSDEMTPKSAFELAMARLQKKDREEGVAARELSDDQKSRLAEVRGFYEAKLAERDILHASEKSRARSLDELESLEEQHRRARERLAAERDRKLEEIRRG